MMSITSLEAAIMRLESSRGESIQLTSTSAIAKGPPGVLCVRERMVSGPLREQKRDARCRS